MKKLLAAFIALVLMFFATSAYADKITIEQGALLVNKTYAGKITKQEWWRDERKLFYNYFIQREDGTLMRATLDPFSESITNMVIENLPLGAELPPAFYDKDSAVQLALKAVESRDKSIFDSEVEAADYTLKDKKPVYTIIIAKGSDNYTVTVDANKGDIIRIDEQR